MDTENWGNSSVQSLETATKDLANSSNTLKTSGSMVLHGQAILKQSGYFATSLPYRKGYKAYVNGQETKIAQVNQTFIGIPLEAGTYEISLFYCPPGKVISCWISLLSLLLFAVWGFLSSASKIKRLSPVRG